MKRSELNKSRPNIQTDIGKLESNVDPEQEVQEKVNKKDTPIRRLREFVNWAQLKGFCKSEYDFERQCNLSPKYIANNTHTGKGNIGTQILGRIIRVFPQLNLVWLCTGDGPMLNQGENNHNADYKQAYEGAQMQIEALNRILRSQNL